MKVRIKIKMRQDFSTSILCLDVFKDKGFNIEDLKELVHSLLSFPALDETSEILEFNISPLEPLLEEMEKRLNS